MSLKLLHRKPRVALKYCGSCNPHVDLPSIAQYLGSVARETGSYEEVPFSSKDVDVMVILCGCARVCGNEEEVRSKAKLSLVIAGDTVAGKSFSGRSHYSVVGEELNRLLKQLTLTCETGIDAP